jgi:hypothetical protein
MKGFPPIGQAKRLDHVVLPVADLGSARARLTALGFTVAPDGLHPFGTSNCCVYLVDGTYLEPLAVTDREKATAAAQEGNVFTWRDAAFRRNVGEEGFSALAFATQDARDDLETFVRTGFSAGEILEFSRPFADPSGNSAIAAFRLAFAADPEAPDIFVFTCQRLNVPNVDRSALQLHANGAAGIAKVVIAADEPTDLDELLLVGSDAPATEPTTRGMIIATPNAMIVAETPSVLKAEYGIEAVAARSPRLAGIVFAVDDLGAVESCFRSRLVTYRRHGRRLSVPPAPGQGTTFVFEVSR